MGIHHEGRVYSCELKLPLLQRQQDRARVVCTCTTRDVFGLDMRDSFRTSLRHHDRQSAPSRWPLLEQPDSQQILVQP